MVITLDGTLYDAQVIEKLIQSYRLRRVLVVVRGKTMYRICCKIS